MLPTLHRLRGKEGLRCLVLCPTRELAIQVADNARGYARNTELFVGLVYGGTRVDADLRDLRAGVEVLVGTPGRVNDHLERNNIDLSNVEILILDEADRMLDMGFKPQIDQILRRCKRTGRQTLFFSATMPNSVKSLAYEMLRDPVTVEAAPKVTTAEGVEQFVYPVEVNKKTDLLLHLLKGSDKEAFSSALVFSRTKFGADRIAGSLTRAGLKVEVEHLLGYRIARVNVPGFSVFAEESLDGEPQVTTVTMPVNRKKEERATRGRRMGKHATKELSPEELQKLLGVSAA
jgi:ATP-dependent RNA helicase RhlE